MSCLTSRQVVKPENAINYSIILSARNRVDEELSRAEMAKAPELGRLLTSVAQKLHYSMRVDRTTEFKDWLNKLKDKAARGRIIKRLVRLAEGNPGDAMPVGEGVSELRLHFGPGYRVYFVQRGPEQAFIIWAGTKASQAQDIETAKKIARNI
jgi:putative addiction module killer protein